MKRILFFSIAMMLHAGAFAQEVLYTEVPGSYLRAAGETYPDDPVADTVFVSEIEIRARKRIAETGMRITRPDSLALRSGLSVNLSELLAASSPVFVKSYGPGGMATAHFRGTAASHSRIVWNGLNLNSPMRGTADLSLLPLYFIDGIYLLHGGSSLAEGSGALGGSIHLENQPDWKHRHVISGLAERASFNTRRYAAKVQSGGNKFLSITRLYFENSDNDFPFFNTGVLPNKADTLFNGEYGKKGALQEFYFRTPDDLTIALRGWLQWNKRSLPQLMSYEGTPRDETQRDDQGRITLEIKKYKPGINFRYSAGYSYSGMKYHLLLLQNNYLISDSKSTEKMMFSQFRIDYRKIDGLSVSAAVEAEYQTVKAFDAVRPEGYLRDRFECGVLADLRYKPSDRTGLFFVSRSELYDKRVIPLIPSVGGEWQVSVIHPLVLKFNMTRNYHKPGLNDLFWIPGGNPDLQPEEGLTGEGVVSFGLAGTNYNFSQTLSAYLSEIQNWIMWQPAENGAWYWEAVNIDRVMSRGLEYDFSAVVRYRDYEFSGSGNYALTRSFRKSDRVMEIPAYRKQLIYIPLHSANVRMGVARKGWTGLLHIGFTGRRMTQVPDHRIHFDNSLDPFFLTNLSLQKKLVAGNLEWGIRAQVDNLFNARYQQMLWRPMPGRNYSITLTVIYLK